MSNSDVKSMPKVSVKLRRLSSDKIIQCPGCPSIFEFPENCARHLLESCLYIKRDNTDNNRCKLIKWILNFYKMIHTANNNEMNKIKINTIMNNSSISPQKTRLEVNLPDIPVSIRCPVCDVYFYNRESCLDHVFRDCLSLQTSSFLYDTETVKVWLSKFFSTNVNSFKFINEMAAKWSTTLCKYCNISIYNENLLMEHLKLYHTSDSNLEKTVCCICNFSALSDEKLAEHVIKKHMGCICGFINKTDFYSLKHHVKLCRHNKECSIQCRICYMSISLDSMYSLTEHILTCKPPLKSLQFDNNTLFFECDLCFRQVLISEADPHLRQHIQQMDHLVGRKKRLRVRLNEIKNYLKPNELKLLQDS